MKIKSLAFAMALGLCAPAVFAENVTFDVPLVGPAPNGSYTTGFDVQHLLSGNFEDTITFTPTIDGFIRGSLVTTGAGSFTNINFTSGSINGIPFDFTAIGTNEAGFTARVFANGPLILTLFGMAGPGLADGSPIGASYSGTLNVGVSPVPEPETYAMMLAGLGLVGFIARRRKKAEKKEAMPVQLSYT